MSSSSWDRMSKVVERYERLAMGQIREMKDLQKAVIQSPNRDNVTSRRQIKQLEEQLLSGLQQLLSLRSDLEDTVHEMFDNRVEPIRRQIQSAVAMNRSLPSQDDVPPPSRSTNPFEEDDAEQESNPYEMESRRYQQQSDVRLTQTKLLAEEAKAKAEATAKIQRDMRDLEEIFTELATIVHQQHDMVDSIEEHVERANQNVQKGNQEVKKAVQYKAAKAPLVAALVGSLAVGGPVGVAAGSAIAGVAAGVGGLVAGVYGGRWFKNAVKKDLDST